MGKRFKILKYILLFIVTAVLAWVVLMVIINRTPEAYEAPVPAVRIARAETGSVSQNLRFNAYVEARSMIPVVPFVAGTIMEYYPEQGMEVSRDQVLVVIDSQPYELQYAQAEAAYLAADASYERVRSLVAVKAATQQNLDEIKAQRDAYKAQMDLAQVQIDYAKVKAPVAGTILTADSAKGSIAAQGNLLCSIADLSDLVVRVNIPEKYYTLINEHKDTLKATVKHGSDTVGTSVNSLSPFVNPQSKTFVLELSLNGDIAAFRPGMFVTVDIEYDRHDGVRVMPLGIRNTDGTMYYYDSGSGKARVINESALVMDDENFIVPSAYSDAQFIIDGQGTVFDGQQVRVIE